MPMATFFLQDPCYCEVVLLLEKISSYNMSPLILTRWSHFHSLKQQRTERGASSSAMAPSLHENIAFLGIFQGVSHWTQVPRDAAKRYVMKWSGSQTGLENAELIEVTQISFLKDLRGPLISQCTKRCSVHGMQMLCFLNQCHLRLLFEVGALRD